MKIHLLTYLLTYLLEEFEFASLCESGQDEFNHVCVLLYVLPMNEYTTHTNTYTNSNALSAVGQDDSRPRMEHNRVGTYRSAAT